MQMLQSNWSTSRAPLVIDVSCNSFTKLRCFPVFHFEVSEEYLETNEYIIISRQTERGLRFLDSKKSKLMEKGDDFFSNANFNTTKRNDWKSLFEVSFSYNCTKASIALSISIR